MLAVADESFDHFVRLALKVLPISCHWSLSIRKGKVGLESGKSHETGYRSEAWNLVLILKLVFAFLIKYLFSLNDSPSKTIKNFLFHVKSSFRSRDIQVFVTFSLPFHTFQIQKDNGIGIIYDVIIWLA